MINSDECPEGGQHEMVPDLEYDSTGETINCNKCGEPDMRVKPVIAIDFTAGMSRNGSQRRAYAVFDKDANIIDAIEYSPIGISGLTRKYPGLPSPPQFKTTPNEIRKLLKFAKKEN